VSSGRPPAPNLILTSNPGFAELALNELVKERPEARVAPEFIPGVWGVDIGVPFTDLAELWRQHPPIFVRHICPVHLTCELTGTTKDISIFLAAVKREFLDLIDPALDFSVQTRILSNRPYKPFDVNSALSDTIQKITQATLNVQAPAQIMSVVVVGKIAYLGLSLAAHNLSDWAGGAHRFARRKEQISRAEFKLLEALDVFRIEMPPRGVALDLGAAPGGWTRILRQRKQYVTAVDPADLHPSLKSDSGVRHYKTTAEAYLEGDPDTFDLIVNDLRQDARDSARLMVRYARRLYPHGFGLMTFKLPEKGRSDTLIHDLIAQAFGILGGAYRVAGARQLFHNRNEITIYLKTR
jgi:23S rRNA (cytidine2498-2'-O)-methyltransferase